MLLWFGVGGCGPYRRIPVLRFSNAVSEVKIYFVIFLTAESGL
jgi:hypothetical protein